MIVMMIDAAELLSVLRTESGVTCDRVSEY